MDKKTHVNFWFVIVALISLLLMPMYQNLQAIMFLKGGWDWILQKKPDNSFLM